MVWIPGGLISRSLGVFFVVVVVLFLQICCLVSEWFGWLHSLSHIQCVHAA